MSEQHEYITNYIDNLPPELRPTEVKGRVLSALRVAWKQGWEPQRLAKAVAAADYGNANNAIALAVYRLEKLATTAPPKTSASEVTWERVEPIPQEWREERLRLIRKIMSGDFKGNPTDAMLQLLARQRGESHGGEE